MAKLKVLLRDPSQSPDFGECILSLESNAVAAITAMMKDVSTAYGEEVPIAIEIDKRVQGAAVGLGKSTGIFAIEISAGPNQVNFEKEASRLLVHEIGHILIQAHGIPTLVPFTPKYDITNSAIMDLSDHPFIWALFQKYRIDWIGFDRKKMEVAFSAAYEAQRTSGFKAFPLLNAKQYADTYFTDPMLFSEIKERLKSLANGAYVLGPLEKVEQIRNDLGDAIYRIDGVRDARTRLQSKLQYRAKTMQWFKNPLPQS